MYDLPVYRLVDQSCHLYRSPIAELEGVQTVREGIELPQGASQAVDQIVQASRILRHTWALASQSFSWSKGPK
jgi:hypothetical protein